MKYILCLWQKPVQHELILIQMIERPALTQRLLRIYSRVHYLRTHMFSRSLVHDGNVAGRYRVSQAVATTSVDVPHLA